MLEFYLPNSYEPSLQKKKKKKERGCTWCFATVGSKTNAGKMDRWLIELSTWKAGAG